MSKEKTVTKETIVKQMNGLKVEYKNLIKNKEELIKQIVKIDEKTIKLTGEFQGLQKLITLAIEAKKEEKTKEPVKKDN